MSDPVPSAASRALEELLEVSPQVDAAVVLERDGGRLIASAPASSDRAADRFAATCVKLVDAAEQARRELGREPVSQVEVATPDGHVFLVVDSTWIVAAVTDADPTVGLVFYDLKTALRAVREARTAAGGDQPVVGNGAAPVTVVQTDGAADDAATASGDDEATATTSAGDGPKAEQSQRWRRRKQQ
jgi:predicted regulator of Ras-like GTPase activity (Roadblock/LC7/MglB family)